IVDELHTYRGTPGTEVAYLIRVLMERIGLSPDSSQLRIIASSASLTSDPSGLSYLEAFFARDQDRFQIIGGDVVTPNRDAIARVQAHAQAFRDLGRTLQTVQRRDLSTAANLFHQAVSAPPTPNVSSERLLGGALEYVDAPSALRAVCCEEVTPQTTLPRSP